jgi:hypothetical protein
MLHIFTKANGWGLVAGMNVYELPHRRNRMGYDIHAREQNFRIPADKKAAALKALKKAGVPVKEGITSLEDALENLGWSPDVVLQKKDKRGRKRKTIGAGDIVGLYFEREHLTDEVEDTLDAIAPFVDADSYLEFEGEDMNVWRYLFDGKKVDEIYPTIDWMKPLLVHTSEDEYQVIPSAERVVINACGAKVVITPESVFVHRGNLSTEIPYIRRTDG